MAPRETPSPYEPTAARYRTPRRNITQQEEAQMLNRAAVENRVAMREFVRQREAQDRQRTRERLIREQGERNWNNIVPATEPRPAFLEPMPGIFLPPPRPVRRQQAQRVTQQQNQQNIQNNENQSPPRGTL